FKKGCYIGQEVIARLGSYDKVQRKLVGVKFSEQLELNNGQFVLEDNGSEVGKVSSFTDSPKLNSTIGLAYIRATHSTPGTHLTLKLANNKIIKAEVHPLPFVK
ncbi:MAG: hypothetical protein OQK56_03090, partial [Ignavibacteriaceae bacterium]|nr:hypothetical protein [Ignavibacteriaceae bacterium]